MKKRNKFGFTEGEIIKIDENQIYWDGTHWIVEKYEYTINNIDYYSTIDGFKLLSDAVSCAFLHLS